MEYLDCGLPGQGERKGREDTFLVVRNMMVIDNKILD